MNTSINTSANYERPRRAVNLFWPIVLIGAGVILLMANAGIVTHDPLVMFLQYWPVLLIVGGIDLIFSRTRVVGTIVSAVLGVVVVLGAMAYLTAPGDVARPAWANFAWNWNWFPRSTQLQTEHIAQPLAGVRAATVELNLPAGRGTLKPATNSSNLVEGDVSYLGTLVNDVRRSGDTASVRLANNFSGFSFLNLGAATQRWDVQLNPGVSYDLRFNVGSGTHDLDAREFDLKSVVLEQGSGDTTLRLPESGQYRVKLDIGSGQVNVLVPRGLPFRVNYGIGSGALNITDARRVSGSNQNGTYESKGFSQGGPHAIFDVEMGSGNVTIR
jgi:uncharacterized membrane protein YphA (DoxX/SURF4 family)